MARTRLLAVSAALVALIAFDSSSAVGMFLHPQDAPVDRLIANVTARLKEQPKDPQAYYTLGRIHHLAFVLRKDKLKAYERPNVLPELSRMFNGWGSPERGAAPLPKPTPEEAKALREHLLAAVENFDKAIALDAKHAHFHLGRASLLDAALVSGLELPPLPGVKAPESKDWKPLYTEAALESYGKAFDLTSENDLKLKNLPIQGIGELISYEAGRHFVQLINVRGVKPEERERVEKIEESLKKLEGLRQNVVTPIVFSFTPAGQIDDLLDSKKSVTFDFDGTGRAQRWPWVRPRTSILVWDPQHTGRITSGKQLFGSVTWWIFWQDGYAALDALDDNRDGQLAGDELKGLAVWTDANGNGKSDAGEVTPIESLGVEAIATRWTVREGEHPHHPGGIRMRDGRVLATWDWVVHPQ